MTPPDEFANIPSPRRRPPWFAAVVVVLAGCLMFHERGDLFFALSASAARDLGDARRISQDIAHAPVNSYVRLRGAPDHESALVLDSQGAWQFTQFLRLLGTNNQIFVHRLPDPLSIERAESDQFTGRLLRIRDLSYDTSIRDYFSSYVSATHFFAPADVLAALGRGGRLALQDNAGETVELGPGETVAFDLARPDVVQIDIPAERFPERSLARRRLLERGATILPPDADTLDAFHRHVFFVTLPGASKTAALSAIADWDPRVRIQPARNTVTARVEDLRGEGGALVIAHAQGADAPAGPVPLSAVLSARTTAKVEIPRDALLLLEGERPRDHLKSIFIVAFLGAFAVVNLLALRRTA